MNKLLITASLIALAIPATASAGEVYIGISGGAAISSDTQDSGVVSTALPGDGEGLSTIAAGTTYSIDTALDTGWVAGAQLGYAFDNGLRLELDGSYSKNDVAGHSNMLLGTTAIGASDSSILTRSAAATGSTVNTLLATGNGDVAIYSGFVNALYDFDLGGIAPYLGAGIGLMSIDANYALGSRALTNDKDTELAYQGIAGLSAELSDAVELFAEYKYRRTFGGSEHVASLLPGVLSIEPEQHLATAGLRLRFGAGAPPPPPPVVRPVAPPPPVVRPVAPPPPPPPPPPAPVARRCATGPYIVFFDWDKSDITAEAAGILNSAVTAYGDCGTAAIMLAGHADRSGSTTYNEGLSQRRNVAVTNYLTGRGIPATRISSEAFGESVNRTATADGVRELQNRRVEISYGPGSGR